MTVFGSRARGEAEPDSDMDVLVDVGTEHLSFADEQQLRRAAGELSIDSGIVLSLLVVGSADTERTGRLLRLPEHPGRGDPGMSPKEIQGLMEGS